MTWKWKVALAVSVAAVSAAAVVLLLWDYGPSGERSSRLSITDLMSELDDEGFARAFEPRLFHFPTDHGPHEEYRTEWWYYTGNLATAGGRAFGFQFTLFRRAVTSRPVPRTSPWAADQVYMAHFALTDVARGRFFAGERFSRGAVGLAGAQAEPLRLWLDDWQVEGCDGAAESTADSAETPNMKLRVAGDGVALELTLTGLKRPVLQGDRGLSAKGPEPGNASYYYSLTRMRARGRIELDTGEGGDENGCDIHMVEGTAWMDREWGTSALGADLAGWDWFALQLDDGRELMYYQLRRRDGLAAPLSAGVLVDAGGGSRYLAADEVSIEVLDHWRSPRGGVYPGRWRLEIPAEGLELDIEPRIPDQELNLSVRYWEGAVEIEGRGAGGSVAGLGYVELTGYASVPAVLTR